VHRHLGPPSDFIAIACRRLDVIAPLGYPQVVLRAREEKSLPERPLHRSIAHAR